MLFTKEILSLQRQGMRADWKTHTRCSSIPGSSFLEAPRKAEHISYHTLFNRSSSTFRRQALPDWPQSCQRPLQGRSLQRVSREGRPSLQPTPLTVQEGGPLSGQPQVIFLLLQQNPRERAQSSSSPDTCWFFSQLLSWPREGEPMLTFLPPQPRSSAYQEWQGCKVQQRHSNGWRLLCYLGNQRTARWNSGCRDLI